MRAISFFVDKKVNVKLLNLLGVNLKVDFLIYFLNGRYKSYLKKDLVLGVHSFFKESFKSVFCYDLIIDVFFIVC